MLEREREMSMLTELVGMNKRYFSHRAHATFGFEMGPRLLYTKARELSTCDKVMQVCGSRSQDGPSSIYTRLCRHELSKKFKWIKNLYVSYMVESGQYFMIH